MPEYANKDLPKGAKELGLKKDDALLFDVVRIYLCTEPLMSGIFFTQIIFRTYIVTLNC